MNNIDIDYILSGKMPISELGLPAPLHNALMRANIKTVLKLVTVPETELNEALKIFGKNKKEENMLILVKKVAELGIPELHLGISSDISNLSKKIKLLKLKSDLNDWIKRAEEFHKSNGGSKIQYEQLTSEYNKLTSIIDSMDESEKTIK